jgi:hypothetical protein
MPESKDHQNARKSSETETEEEEEDEEEETV